MQNLRAGAAEAYRALRPTTTSTPGGDVTVPVETNIDGSVEISNIHFSVDPGKRREISLERDRIREALVGSPPTRNE
jgi:hypothetical protein